MASSGVSTELTAVVGNLVIPVSCPCVPVIDGLRLRGLFQVIIFALVFPIGYE
jgi:hypothetical protein